MVHGGTYVTYQTSLKAKETPVLHVKEEADGDGKNAYNRCSKGETCFCRFFQQLASKFLCLYTTYLNFIEREEYGRSNMSFSSSHRS
jgi:hypothetical protein